jgi:diphthamide biosynthesis protein 2
MMTTAAASDCCPPNAGTAADIDEIDIEEYYEINRISQEIINIFRSTLSPSRKARLLKIALQFPDSALHHSPDVSWIMEKKIDDLLSETAPNCDASAFCFVLGDTTSNDCCADEVAARHLDADVLVHYGHACLSATSGNLPVIYSFGRLDFDVDQAIDKLEETLSANDGMEQNNKKFLILYQVEYYHAVSTLTEQWSARHIDDVKFKVVAGEVPSSHSDFCSSLALGGLRFLDLDWNEISTFTVIFILDNPEGTNSRQHKVYINAMLQLLSRGDTSGRYWTYSPSTKSLCTQPASHNALQRQLKRRFFLTTKARDANVFGILVSNLGQKNLVNVVKSLQGLVHDAGKTAYSFAVGKINPAKLANFADVEVFCLVSCQEHALLDGTAEREDYVTPVITPMELEIALGKLNWADKPYSLDCQDVLKSVDGNTNGEGADNDDTEDDTPYFSLATGRMMQCQRNSRKNEVDDKTSTEGPSIAGGGAIIEYDSEASNFLKGREYKGLEKLTGSTEAKPAVQGLVGIASKYKQNDINSC